MFTNLNLVKRGDTFYFRVLNKVLAYKVDQILTVEPDQVTSLSGVMGKIMLLWLPAHHMVLIPSVYWSEVIELHIITKSINRLKKQ